MDGRNGWPGGAGFKGEKGDQGDQGSPGGVGEPGEDYDGPDAVSLKGHKGEKGDAPQVLGFYWLIRLHDTSLTGKCPAGVILLVYLLALAFLFQYAELKTFLSGTDWS